MTRDLKKITPCHTQSSIIKRSQMLVLTCLQRSIWGYSFGPKKLQPKKQFIHSLIQALIPSVTDRGGMIQDTNYMAEINSPIVCCFWGLFNASVSHKWLKGVYLYKNYCWNVAVNSHYLPSSQMPLVLVKNDPNRLYGLEDIQFSLIFRPFWGLIYASGTQIGIKIGSLLAK